MYKDNSKKTTHKNYTENFVEVLFASEPAVSYGFLSTDFITLSREGILKRYLISLAQRLTLTMQELAKVLHISERTLQRYRPEDTLASEVSERAILLAQLFEKGKTVFGNTANFNDWLRTPLPAFEQQTPLSFLDTTFGFQLVKDELGRIEHGIFA